MVRAPCCEKMGLKKGPWTPEEDQILINYIQQYGHGNWRALPKQAGLLRCGKSCRLRWTNYLRPDIKRGNFSREEEDTIINLHEMLGNRWSAIAARLPGRTDNEIKNVWHTHLKKRLKQNNGLTATTTTMATQNIKRQSIINNQEIKTETEVVDLTNNNRVTSEGIDQYRPISPQQCSSEVSSMTNISDDQGNNMSIKLESSDGFSEMDENFWLEVLSNDNLSLESDFSMTASGELQFQFPFSSVGNNSNIESVQYGCSSNMYDSMDFWYNLFTRAGESLDLPEFE